MNQSRFSSARKVTGLLVVISLACPPIAAILLGSLLSVTTEGYPLTIAAGLTEAIKFLPFCASAVWLTWHTRPVWGQATQGAILFGVLAAGLTSHRYALAIWLDDPWYREHHAWMILIQIGSAARLFVVVALLLYLSRLALQVVICADRRPDPSVNKLSIASLMCWTTAVAAYIALPAAEISALKAIGEDTSNLTMLAAHVREDLIRLPDVIVVVMMTAAYAIYVSGRGRGFSLAATAAALALGVAGEAVLQLLHANWRILGPMKIEDLQPGLIVASKVSLASLELLLLTCFFQVLSWNGFRVRGFKNHAGQYPPRG